MIRLLNWLKSMFGICCTIEATREPERRKQYKRITHQDIVSVMALYAKNKDVSYSNRLSYKDIALLHNLSASSVGRIIRGEIDVKESN